MFALKRNYDRNIAELRSASEQYKAFSTAVKRNNAYVIFSVDGYVTETNEIFASIFGFTGTELTGRHHSSLCFDNQINESAYRQFWQDLRHGKAFSGQYLRKHRNGGQVWIEASYEPILTDHGDVIGVVKVCCDITQQKVTAETNKAISDALNRSMAVIEFTPDGTVLSANENFLKTVGYSLSQIQGQHHRLFCFEDFYTANPDFWKKLAGGTFHGGQFKRKTANGGTVWLEATYNPIFSAEGHVYKIIKFAADITDSVTEKNNIASASEHAISISEETSQIALRGTESLSNSVTVFTATLKEVDSANVLIEQLTTQSANIEQIVSTIRGIADQTNLLALNAAIEAARAGDQGRGFAVVADEVRQLAKRTSDSTVEIETVVNANRGLAKEARDKMAVVKINVDKNAEQIHNVQAVMNEIYEGAISVTENVSLIVNR